MKYLFSIINWFLVIVIGLLAISTALTGNLIRAILLLLIVLLLLAPVIKFAESKTGKSLSPQVRIISIFLLLALFVLLGAVNKPQSIYKSPEVEAKLMAIYDEKLEQWPVPYEIIYVDTSYGRVHVIASGPQDASPVLLLHASGLSSWSWIYNVEELSQHYRVYAIDTIGDAGKSVLSDPGNYPQDGKALSDLYVEISDRLGAEQAYVVGASQGGYIAMNYALYAPERVEKLVLLGPMGYHGSDITLLRMVLVTIFPIKPLQDNVFNWAFGDDPEVRKAYNEWFRLVMTGYIPHQARPLRFTPEQLQNMKVPVLLVLGEKDGLIGNPEKARKLAQNIPDIQIEVLDTGHAIGVEQPDQVNALIYEFFGNV